jgi:hypothetical protein
MFKVRDLFIQSTLKIGEAILEASNNVLFFQDRGVATYDPENFIPGTMLTIGQNGTLMPVENVGTVSIYIDTIDGDDEGYGSELSPLKTIDKAIEVSQTYQMFHSVRFIISGNGSISKSATLQFPSEIEFIGTGDQKVEIELVDDTDGTFPELNVESRARVILDNIRLFRASPPDEVSSFLTGRLDSVTLLSSAVELIENLSLVETYFAISVNLIGSSLDNTSEKIVINPGGSFVFVSADSFSSIQNSNKDMLCTTVLDADSTPSSNCIVSF